MARFTKEVRRKIVEEYAAAHGGVFDADGFLAEVQKTGADHPAWSWFAWDDQKAAHDFRINQAREFVRDLKISVKIETFGPGRAIQVRTVEAPFVVSPMANRGDGGGYNIVDPSSPESRRLLCQEAATALKAFFRRYELAVAVAGIPVATAEDLVARLEDAGGQIAGKVALVNEG